MLSSSLNMALSLPASKDSTCLTANIAVVVELARHFNMPRSKIRRIVKFISENFSGAPSLQLSSELNQQPPNYRTFPPPPSKKSKTTSKEKKTVMN
ncbi:hypothetical protein AVEN_89452-1 [Araneus ventricosus]|uniref:Uncharacterized protein n=1 Tax=Araneus ventricosus TaxID=182803 RepID=A0A4Y2HNR4_ARAVE|nr:hypothetical protein AVEN_89452-1 [Araneus ventricosus]